MKWYFACNDKSVEFFPLIKAAVLSALENTTLKPNFIYDGQENELTEWLSEHGVNIINHQVNFYDELKNYYTPEMLKIASGAFLRCDIPIIEQEDEFVLYTDCDVIFMKDPDVSELKPDYFACSSQFDKKNFKDFNTGVMLMNVKKLKESHKIFKSFIVENLTLFNAFDQTAYQIFYSGKNTKLSVEFNYKPYWGVDAKAVILHFHGPKPTSFVEEETIKKFPLIFDELYRKNPTAYDFYLELFKKYSPEIEYSLTGIEKLKQGLYPLNKGKKAPLLSRIKSRLAKLSKQFLQKFSVKSF